MGAPCRPCLPPVYAPQGRVLARSISPCPTRIRRPRKCKWGTMNALNTLSLTQASPGKLLESFGGQIGAKNSLGCTKSAAGTIPSAV